MRLFTKERQRTLKSCEGRTVRISENEFRVKDYTVYKSRKGWICECKHYVYKQTPCSHIVYAATHPLVPIEIKHVAHLPDKVVFGHPYDMYGLMSVMAVMLPPSLPLGEAVRIPPGLRSRG